MKGSMRNRGNDAWELRVFTGTDIHGKKQWVTRTFHGGQRDAETALSAFVTEVSEHRVPISGGMTLAAYLRKWMQARRLKVSDATIIIQQGIIDRHINPHIGNRKLSKLEATDFEGLYAYLGESLSLKTIDGVHAVLDTAYRDAVRKGTLSRNPLRLVDRTRGKQQEIDVPPKDDVFRAISHAPPIIAMGMAIIAATGLRRGELLALRWQEIDLERKTIRVSRNLQYLKKQIVIKPPKTASGRRTVILPDALVSSLRDYRRWQREYHLKHGIRTDLVIHNRQGEPFKPTTYSAAVKGAGDKAGLVNLGPHTLRHLHATHLLEEGIHPRVVQERLGHANIMTTLTIYSHVLEHMQDKAAAAADGLVCPSFCPSNG